MKIFNILMVLMLVGLISSSVAALPVNFNEDFANLTKAILAAQKDQAPESDPAVEEVKPKCNTFWCKLNPSTLAKVAEFSKTLAPKSTPTQENVGDTPVINTFPKPKIGIGVFPTSIILPKNTENNTVEETGEETQNPLDTDNDGILNTDDNCPETANADQANSDGDLLGDACDSDSSATNQDNTPNTVDSNLSVEEQTLVDFETEFKSLDDEWDLLKDDYNDAEDDSDFDELEDIVDDLENLDDDLNDLLEDVEDFENDTKDDKDMDKSLRKQILNDVDDLIKDIKNLREDIDLFVNGPSTTQEADYFVSPVNTGVSASNVVIEPLQFTGAISEPTSNFDNLRLVAWSIAGIIMLLAIIVFLVAVLLR